MAMTRGETGTQNDTRTGHDSHRSDRPTVLSVRGVHKSFHGRVALAGIDFDINEGEVVVILGRSGSGKSTLARCIQQLEPIDAGSIYLDGELLGYEHSRRGLRPLKPGRAAVQRAKIGTVFQHFNLFPHLTVLENITLAPRRVQNLTKRDANERATSLLERVGLADRAGAYPKQLSGGQQQRVAIARTLAMEPRLLIFDEATSALDPELVGEVLGVIKGLTAEGDTMFVVTHEIQFAREVADRVIFLDGGVIAASGTVSEVIDNPQLDALKRFLARSARAQAPGESAR